MPEPDKSVSLLGLARRAGKLVPGFDAAAQAARKGEAVLLLAAADLSEKTWKNLRYEADRAGIPARRLSTGIDQTSRACGLKKTGVLAVTDRGFAKALLRQMDQKEETSV